MRSLIRVVFCTARISGASHPMGARDQNVYLRALTAAKSVDVIQAVSDILADAKGKIEAVRLLSWRALDAVLSMHPSGPNSPCTPRCSAPRRPSR
ncbi:hypothetical protein QRX50_04990 [Amycolatopsis carbonis]|uniref:Uncharacterized protein n=1 Tax=Amycolatopsis carbonis TaxID=715471 RepID=A0A9Y2IIP4_9PSEU|nr:hypothetical protein [Amycolatopsis sp. 2-15]WIX80149.1 hypothetical protein QRX50_04990 [Amycolatopsis sp. 2-15]